MNRTPRTAPEMVTAIRGSSWTGASGFRIQIPGMVKASPPATMAPELMTVCVTLISRKVASPQMRSTDMLSTAAKRVGQGSAPMRRATYMELEVMITDPRSPMIRLRTVRSGIIVPRGFTTLIVGIYHRTTGNGIHSASVSAVRSPSQVTFSGIRLFIYF